MTYITKLKIKGIALIFGTAWAGGLALGYVMFHDTATTPTNPAYHQSKPAQTYDQAAFLMKLHHCWSGQAPADMAGKIPGHAVVTPRGYWPMYVGAKLTGQALDQEFGGEDHGLRIWGFCR